MKYEYILYYYFLQYKYTLNFIQLKKYYQENIFTLFGIDFLNLTIQII